MATGRLSRASKGTSVRKVVGAVAVAMAAVSAMGATGCSDDKPTAAKCEQVSAPMTDIPTRTDQEPRLRIPQPQGWERTTKLDSETIRFALRNPGLADAVSFVTVHMLPYWEDDPQPVGVRVDNGERERAVRLRHVVDAGPAAVAVLPQGLVAPPLGVGVECDRPDRLAALHRQLVGSLDQASRRLTPVDNGDPLEHSGRDVTRSEPSRHQFVLHL